MTVAAQEFYPTDIKDFGPLLTRVLLQKPDAIDTAAGGRGPLFLQMMKELDQTVFAGPVFGSPANRNAMQDGRSFIKSFTTAVLVDWRAPVVSTEESVLIKRYIEKYNEAELETLNIYAYNMPLVLAQAMQKAGTVVDTTKLAQTLRDGEWDSLNKQWGKARFVGAKTLGQPAVLQSPVYLSRVENGRLETFKVMQGSMP